MGRGGGEEGGREKERGKVRRKKGGRSIMKLYALAHILTHVLNSHTMHIYTCTLPCSAFMCTNETVNIWSHLLGLLYFMFLTLHDNFFFLPQNRADFGDHLTFTILDLCFQVESLPSPPLPPDSHPVSPTLTVHVKHPPPDTHTFTPTLSVRTA